MALRPGESFLTAATRDRKAADRKAAKRERDLRREEADAQKDSWATSHSVFVPKQLAAKPKKAVPKKKTVMPGTEYRGGDKRTASQQASDNRRAQVRKLNTETRRKERFQLGLKTMAPKATIFDAVPVGATKHDQEIALALDHPPKSLSPKELLDWRKKMVGFSTFTPGQKRQRLKNAQDDYDAYRESVKGNVLGLNDLATVGKTVANAAAEGLRPVTDILIANPGRLDPRRGSDVRTGRDLAEKYEKATELATGKSLANVAFHGDLPDTWGQAGGLAAGVATLGPGGKALRAAGVGGKLAFDAIRAEEGIKAALAAGKAGAGAAYAGPSNTAKVIKWARDSRANRPFTAKKAAEVKAVESMLVEARNGMREAGNHDAADQIDLILKKAGIAVDPGVRDIDPVIARQVAERAGLTSLDEALPTPKLTKAKVNSVAKKAFAEYKAQHPNGRMTLDQMTAITQRMHGYAKRGVEGALWYEKSSARALMATGGDVEESTRIMRVVAYLSAANAVKPNVGTAIKAWQEFKETGVVTRVGRYPQRQTPQVEEILKGGDWAGRKSNNFERNFVEDVNPEMFAELYPDDPGFVTVDRWIKEIVDEGSRDTGVGDAEYTAAQSAIRGLTDAYGWGRPKRTQAAMWVSIKADTEGTKIADIAGDDVSAFLESTEYVGRTNLGAEAWPGFADLPPGLQAAFTDSQTLLARDALRRAGFAVMRGQGDEGGLNILVGSTRLPKNPADPEKVLKVSPDEVLVDAKIFIGGNPKDPANYTTLVTPAERQTMDAASAFVGQHTDQDVAAWVRVFPINNRGFDGAHTTLGYFNVGRRLSTEEMRAVTEAVGRAEAKLGGKGGNLVAIHADDGFMVFDKEEGRFLHRVTKGSSKRGSLFKTTLMEELNPVIGKDVEGSNWFAHAGAYNEASDYGRVIDESGRAGALRRQGDNLHTSVQRLRARFTAAAADPRDPGGKRFLASVVASLNQPMGIVPPGMRGGSRFAQGIAESTARVNAEVAARGVPRFTSEATPRTALDVSKRIVQLDAELDPIIADVARGLKQEGIGAGTRQSLARAAGKPDYFQTPGAYEQAKMAAWDLKKSKFERANPGKEYGGRHFTDQWDDWGEDERFVWGDAETYPLESGPEVKFDRSTEWYRQRAEEQLMRQLGNIAAEGGENGRKARRMLIKFQERESLRRLEVKNQGGDLFPEDVPAGGYGADLKAKKLAPPRTEEQRLEDALRPKEPPPVPPERPTRVSIPAGGGRPPVPPRPVAEQLPGEPFDADFLKEIKSRMKKELPSAKPVRAEQEGLRSEARADRLKVALHEMEKAPNGVEAMIGMRQALHGDLPRLDWHGFDFLDQPAIDALHQHIIDRNDFQGWEKVRLVWALDRVVSKGRIPTKSEHALLNRLIGPTAATNLGDPENLTLLRKLYHLGLEIWNTPRSIMASFDLSAPFRQGLVAGARHPLIFARNIKPMLKAFKSEDYQLAVMNDIANDPNFGRAEVAGIGFTDIHGFGAAREEQFPGSLAERVPFRYRGKGLDNPVVASGRAYSVFLNKMRMDIFNHMLDVAGGPETGMLGRFGKGAQKDLDDKKFLKALGEYINNSTGRGKIPGKHGEDAAQFLNTFLFSPRLLASRFNIMSNPVYYARLMHDSPFVARQQAQAALTTLGGMITVLTLASQTPGWRVSWNPTSSDFGKIRIGDTRIDVAGGFQPLLVAYMRILKNRTTVASTGQNRKLGGYGGRDQWGVGERFLESKLAPVPGVGRDILHDRKTFVGEPMTLKGMALNMLTPLNLQATLETWKNDGYDMAAVAAVLSSIGFGTNSFPDTSPTDSGGGGGGAPVPAYAGSESSSGGGSSGGDIPTYDGAP